MLCFGMIGVFVSCVCAFAMCFAALCESALEILGLAAWLAGWVCAWLASGWSLGLLAGLHPGFNGSVVFFRLAVLRGGRGGGQQRFLLN